MVADKVRRCRRNHTFRSLLFSQRGAHAFHNLEDKMLRHAKPPRDGVLRCFAFFINAPDFLHLRIAQARRSWFECGAHGAPAFSAWSASCASALVGKGKPWKAPLKAGDVKPAVDCADHDTAPRTASANTPAQIAKIASAWPRVIGAYCRSGPGPGYMPPVTPPSSQ